MKLKRPKKATLKLAKIVLVILLLAIPAYCCEIYVRNDDGEYILTIDNVTNVGVCDLNLTYDSNLVDITDVVGESFDYFDYNRVDLGDGKNVLRTQAFQINNPGLSGLIDYAILKLQINDDDQGEIGIGVIEIVEDSPEVKPIPHTVRNFAVSEPVVTVNSPDGGENWKAGTAEEIRWTATDNVGVTSVDIAYSTDGGATYQMITTGISDSGAYNWTIPNTASGTCLVKVIAHDAAGNAGEGVSDAAFTIIAALSSTTTTTSVSHRRSSRDGTYPPGWGVTPTPTSPPTPTPAPRAAPAVTPATTPLEVATPAVVATQEPGHVTKFRTEPKSTPSPILTPIAGIVIVVIASIMGGIVKVISLTTAHPESAGRETEGRTDAEAVAPVEERNWKKSLAAIVGIVVIAVVAIIAIAVM
ncbi:MAG: hypothetical protein EF813_06335 [Methanosarcinales archaeon]|nr:MAG: hypothetical protein EF813_06335 [Methanosarcinales archaeon]